MIAKTWLLRGYVALLLGCGLAVLAGFSGSLRAVDWGPNAGEGLLLWATMATVAAISPLPLPWRNSRFSWMSAVDLGAILVFGPAVACWFAVLSRLGAAAARRWEPASDAALNLGRSICGIGVAGAIYTRLHGRVGDELFIDIAHLIPIVACGLSYVLATTVLAVPVRAARRQQSVRQAFLAQARSKGVLDLLMLPFGALLAVTQVRIGAVAVALFLIALLLARYALVLWLRAQRDHLALTRTLMAAVDGAEALTRGHSLRVSKMCVQIARKMGLSKHEVARLEYAALLHDIGRTAIRREVLFKSGKLTPVEFMSVQAHPRFSHDVLEGLAFFKGAAEIVHCHHEQPDGKGYPRGLTAENIPLGSRIIMVVAAFDALTSDRPYRRGLDPEAAFEELLSNTGTQFFPEIVELLIQLYSTGELFAGFDAKEFEYLTGESGSRAVAAYLERRKEEPAVRSKRGVDGEEAAADSAVVEMPQQHLRARFPLDARGALRLVVAGESDVGCIRSNNEDSFGAFPNRDAKGGLLVVADGMGGAAAGEVASKMAVDLISDGFHEALPRQGARGALVAAIAGANGAIFSRARKENHLSGMGTTCAAAAIIGCKLFHAHVGDSRVYLIAGGNMALLTRDHTVSAELGRVAGGGRTAAQMKHVLTRCLGNGAEIEVDAGDEPIDLSPGDTVLLCTDGLWNLITAEEMQEIAGGVDTAEAARQLVELARSRGGDDNTTVQLARVEDAADAGGAPGNPTRQPGGRGRGAAPRRRA